MVLLNTAFVLCTFLIIIKQVYKTNSLICAFENNGKEFTSPLFRYSRSAENVPIHQLIKGTIPQKIEPMK